MLKNKRIILIVFAIVFIALLLFLKTKSQFKNQAAQDSGLSYGNILVKDLLNKDTDNDGVLDWEESLWGTDPTNKDTDGDGVPDSTEVAQMKPAGAENGESEAPNPEEENLSQTDKFSRELFATVATLNQTGQVDQNTVDTLSASLVEKIKNSPVRKIFLTSEIKILNDNSNQAYLNYSNALNNIYKQYPIQGNALDVLQKFINDGESVNLEALAELDPIINQTKGFMDGMIKTAVPAELAQLHLDIINALERLIENLSDLQLFESDVIVAMGGMSKYEENAGLLELATSKLIEAINHKLNT